MERSHTSCQPRLLPMLLTSYICRLEVPMTLSLGSINLLEWLTELRETFYLLDYQFILKGYNSGTARCKRYTGQRMGKGRRASMPPPPVSTWSPTRKLSKNPASFGVLWRLHYISMTGPWPWSQLPAPLSGGQEDGTLSSYLPATWLALPETLDEIQNSPAPHNKRHLNGSNRLGKATGLGALCQEQWKKNTYFLL